MATVDQVARGLNKRKFGTGVEITPPPPRVHGNSPFSSLMGESRLEYELFYSHGMGETITESYQKSTHQSTATPKTLNKSELVRLNLCFHALN
ncbi:hypothetical protein CEXT_430251 [Caerostris extrusa]|uniref:Uncharacterized protein n=1 Tax=Caerostris extrusa TaxID=172846 RepID=A0AAV4XY15_CAEEX|nr:hypothetical protein CEXT_430251 [Caerostris extrusa]